MWCEPCVCVCIVAVWYFFCERRGIELFSMLIMLLWPCDVNGRLMVLVGMEILLLGCCRKVCDVTIDYEIMEVEFKM